MYISANLITHFII